MAEVVNLTGPITLDLDAISDKPVATGWHLVNIERAEAKLSSADNPKIFVMSRIVDEADPDNNRTLIWNLTFTEAAMFMVKRCLKALGMPSNLSFDSLQDLADELLDREVEAFVKHKVYMGETQANVAKWRAPEVDIEL